MILHKEPSVLPKNEGINCNSIASITAASSGELQSGYRLILDSSVMTTGEWIVIGIFVVGILCSISLFWWLIRTVRRDKRRNTKP